MNLIMQKKNKTNAVEVLAILQARMSSTRLPGKVLKPILGKPMIQHQIERILRSTRIDKLVVATSTRKDDDQIEKLCNKIGVDIFRGSLENVLDRFYRAASRYKPNSTVRLTGDCPLTDPFYIDLLIDFYLEKDCDFSNNGTRPTLPHGLDAAIFSFYALEEAWKKANLPSDLEHVTPYILKRPEKFKIKFWKNKKNLSHLRWTVDEPADFEFVKKVYESLYPTNPEFNTKDILELIKEQPIIQEINSGFTRNAGIQHTF